MKVMTPEIKESAEMAPENTEIIDMNGNDLTTILADQDTVISK